MEIGFLIYGAVAMVAVLAYIRWQKKRDNVRWPGIWR